MNVTFHIIIDATETKKGGIICKDIYYNSIYISKHIQEIYDFDLSNISYPFYLNAEKKAINSDQFFFAIFGLDSVSSRLKNKDLIQNEIFGGVACNVLQICDGRDFYD